MNAARHDLRRRVGRQTLAALLAAAGMQFTAVVQAQPRPARIGLVSVGVAWGQFATHTAFAQGMQEQGLLEGRDYVVEFRATGGDPTRQAPLAEELVRLPVDMFMAVSCGEPLDAVRRATRTIPIVVVACNEDLVSSGIVKSLNRPGGNITGQSKLSPELAAKRLELLREVLPSARRVAVLWNPGYSPFTQDWRELRAAADKLGFKLEPVEFRRAADLDAAFAAVERSRPDALMTFSDVTTYVLAKPVAERAAAARLPSMHAYRELPDAGGLMSYGPNILDLFRHSASYFARIQRGASPAELPIELPTRFELVVNQKTAQALGLKLPNTVLLRADEVIE